KNTKENLHPHLSNHRLWLPPVPQDTPGKISLFASLSQTLRTNFQLCPTYSLAKSKLQQLASEENWKTIYTHSEEWKNTLSTILPTTNVLSTNPHYDKHALATADASITNCECLIAQTGSVLISSTYCGGRNLSVLPPHHVVLAEVSQLVGDLTDAFLFLQQKYGSNLPPYISIITGPSRTGDIERILVLGAHGPKKLSIILIEENPPP
ncbi:MAG: lactate utilization protein, partial [Chthoniobacterales bacterium]|nr:lactate utilization protein [Chthoniobacterales bacterium]